LRVRLSASLDHGLREVHRCSLALLAVDEVQLIAEVVVGFGGGLAICAPQNDDSRMVWSPLIEVMVLICAGAEV
jgi:hypothetical protein